jgi:caffeoyl-CoA O-methyltransferase
MSGKFIQVTPELDQYITSRSTARDPLLTELAEETARLGGVSVMQISQVQGAFMNLIAHAVGVRSAVEVGTFTGYSAICIARALPPGGRLLCCDVSTEWTQIARRYFARAGVSDKIDLRIGPALATLRALPEWPQFDLAFIDADKVNQGNYFDELLPRVRPGGLLLIDNVLRDGRVIDARESDADLNAVRALNDRLPGDRRIEAVMLPIADGLTVCRKL